MSASAPVRQRTGSIMDALVSKNQATPLPNDIRIGGLSIVIPVRNRPDLLRRCLESLISLKVRPLQIIVVDDGSDDETPEMAEGLVDSFRVRNIDLVVERTKQRGAPHARNWGTARSTCAFVIFMDSDDYFDADGLDQLIYAVANVTQELDFAYGNIEKIGREGESRGFVGERWMPGDDHQLLSYSWCTTSVLYRRSFLEEIGGWRQELTGSQDWELQVRAKLASRSVFYAPIRIAYWVDHAGPRIGTQVFRQSYTEAVLIACGYILSLLFTHRKATPRNVARLVGRALMHIRELRHHGVSRHHISQILDDYWPHRPPFTTVLRAAAWGIPTRHR